MLENIRLKYVHLFVCHFASLVAYISPGLQHQFSRFLLSCGACHAWSKEVESPLEKLSAKQGVKLHSVLRVKSGSTAKRKTISS